MVDTIKFSQFVDGGDLEPNQVTVGLEASANTRFSNPFPLLPPGSTGDRPTPAAAMYFRLRFNTTLESYEYYSPVLVAWIQLVDTVDIFNGPVITYTADADLPNAFNLGLLTTGILMQTVTAGISTPAIAVNGVDYYGPGYAGYYQAPAGIKDANGNIVLQFASVASAVNYLTVSNQISGQAPIISAAGTDTNISMAFTAKGNGVFYLETTASAAALNFVTGTGYQHSTSFTFADTAAARAVTWQDADGTVAFLGDLAGYVQSVTGTANEIEVNNTDPQNPIVLLPSVLNVPGTFNIQSTTAISAIINDNTMATAAATNLSTSLAIKTYVDSQVAGSVTSGQGTANQVLVNGTSGTPETGALIFTLPQSIATTSSPTFAALTLTAALTVPNGGTGLQAFTAFNIIAGGTTTTGSLQQLGSGNAGQLLISNGAGALASWTTATFPSGSGTLNHMLRSDGTNWVQTTATVLDASDNLSGLTTITSSGAITATAAALISGTPSGGTAGFLSLFANTAALGSMNVTAANNAGNYTNVLINASTSASRTWTLPDATGTVLVTGAAINSVPSITFSSTSGIIGTTTNNNAAAGSVGEFVSSTVLVGSAVNLVNLTATNATSISLTAGDWDVYGNICFTGGATTNVRIAVGWISSTSATQPTNDNSSGFNYGVAGFVPFSTGDLLCTVPSKRFSLSGTTTIYLSAVGVFSISTMAIYGTIYARRRR